MPGQAEPVLDAPALRPLYTDRRALIAALPDERRDQRVLAIERTDVDVEVMAGRRERGRRARVRDGQRLPQQPIGGLPRDGCLAEALNDGLREWAVR